MSLQMARPHKCRWIAARPVSQRFKPAGVPGRGLLQITLRLDELEALRLADLEGLYHDQAAERMGVSRPTFGRLLDGARRKVADALLNAKMLVFSGGNITMAEMRRFQCNSCGAFFEVAYGGGRPAECPGCHSTNFCRANGGGGAGRGRCRRRGRGGANAAGRMRGGGPAASVGRIAEGDAQAGAAPDQAGES